MDGNPMTTGSELEPVIGLEVHAELQTQSKMFCACPVVDSATAAPNSASCEICTGMPGTLPAELPYELPQATDDGPPILDLGSAFLGQLSYPSEGIPSLKVVAFDVITQAPVASVETEAGQSSYSLSVPDGIYYVVAYTLDGQLAGGYTNAVLCGLSVECTDHSLLPVPAANGTATDGIDPADWYAPAGSFPPAP